MIEFARRGGKLYERIASLFPRYVFLHLTEGNQALGPVFSTVGVTSVVRFGSHYAIVPDVVVRDLQARADPESGLHHLSSGHPLPGDAVRIVTGPFDGLEGVFQRVAGADRVVVLLKLLGRDAEVRVRADCVWCERAA